ncbi:hypothetical protein A2331_04605 [Candidatus Falkowbacteria bacterium RIFOXYB2_FULL_34_18]|uniref:Uncharacterized protein n=1 Tax=Candidatus Falkowbacteria bacterium RIFOXYD2_FULL_34_120 TaxID=1798007 RepID=A0A1F5TR55_9BACT|nr:MAG: hypothetical protein A2331_04605 [Candidatus Falkowbacteria bacterium RIFOXYB2_FULL_34_18]OGF29347.1 MAG: hypothetical protein A2500_06190 [Candidatus Falkowbacteria bacterium RIFOXYC12_FULL_34_55]OGF36538.1 MAG: hypothetical protein A2466_07230 [Candidatus Falkowbacteria bacterium RIFOXYC2_FULL_34_220]OGF38770.1 MAG: hypothetical protein A2515_03340 [Candidatus Falkowbacteria bacterium RIFOXYD12_FULL_34_57]OGF41011.1 MAG: hypothetical protein A2531_03585 [Candidatus Falkowbacteria bact
MDKLNLKVLSDSELIAQPGKFRVAVIIDSEIYQIREDVYDIEIAKHLCFTEAGDHPVAIFDDQGNNRLKYK